MDQKLEAALEKLKAAAGSIRGKEDVINFLVKETKLPKEQCEQALEMLSKMDVKELADKLPDGIADKIPTDLKGKIPADLGKKFGL